jgi:hypothetical protein
VADNRPVEGKLASGLAERVVVTALVALVVYWMLPGAGPSELKRMNVALQNAKSWRVQTVVTEPTKNVNSLAEAYCD